MVVAIGDRSGNGTWPRIGKHECGEEELMQDIHLYRRVRYNFRSELILNRQN